ncbi:ASCH domain-containing protein [Saccharothrix stipae]
MKTLSIRQPWAWAVAKGYKPVENRSRATTHRGPLAIHASKMWDRPEEHNLRTVVRRARADGHEVPKHLRGDLPYSDVGMVIAVVDVVDVCTAARTGERCNCGPWAHTYETHWRLDNARLLREPFPAKGRLGLWECDDPRLLDVLSVAHRSLCDGRGHVAPVGFNAGEPYEPNDHGEPWPYPDNGQPEQCMCGHPTYYTCPDWLGIDAEVSRG